MNRTTSVYLDAVRFLAACTVFVDHMSSHRFTGGMLWQTAPYGPEAVDVFFVLSGFVIGYVTDRREIAPLDYSVSRAARIYSVAIPALITTFVLDTIGHMIDPHLYSAALDYASQGRVWQFLYAVLFLNQTWFNYITPGSDIPYWSLGYEVWYYVVFGAAIFAPRKWRIAAVVALLAMAGPKIAALFPIWLLGVVAYRICSRMAVPISISAVLCFGSAGLWVIYEVHCWRDGRPIGPNWIGKPEIIQDYVIGVLFFLHLIGFRFVSHWAEPLLRTIERPVRWMAGATLTLYLFHFPIAQFFAAVTPWPPSAWPTRLLIYAGVPLLVFLIAEVTERRKAAWRRGLQNLVGLLNPTVAR